MNEITTIGLDLAKHVFQVHGVDATGRRFCASGCGVVRCWRSSAGCRAACWGGGVCDGALLGAGVARAAVRKSSRRPSLPQNPVPRVT